MRDSCAVTDYSPELFRRTYSAVCLVVLFVLGSLIALTAFPEFMGSRQWSAASILSSTILGAGLICATVFFVMLRQASRQSLARVLSMPLVRWALVGANGLFPANSVVFVEFSSRGIRTNSGKVLGSAVVEWHAIDAVDIALQHDTSEASDATLRIRIAIRPGCYCPKQFMAGSLPRPFTHELVVRMSDPAGEVLPRIREIVGRYCNGGERGRRSTGT